MTLRRRIGIGVATAFGAGYSPIAPGTVGTLVAVPLAWGLGGLSTGAYLLVTAALSGVAFWAASVAEEAFGEHDSGKIVIDEVVGYLLTMFPVAKDGLHLALGFLAFRLFDIWKPPPIRQIDARVGGGVGVVLDDLAAGAYAALAVFALSRTGVVEALRGVLG